MKRTLPYILIPILLMVLSIPLASRGVDPESDAKAIARMRERMDEIRKHRPTVALVLSGGGAKGAAHVGVIEHIESLGIPVDMVLGTSMGGLVGGLYALGYTVPEMDSLIRNMDWNWALSDRQSRDYVSYNDVKYKEKYLLSIPFYHERDYYNMMLADEHRFDHVKKHEILHIGADNEGGGFLLQRLQCSHP